MSNETVKREFMEIHLPPSKSISNRVLLLRALAGEEAVPENPADCDDTRVMGEALSSSSRRIDVGHAGTAMRFLTAYFSCLPGCRELTGSPRMQQRPIGPLVDALNCLGGRVEYMGRSGYPPLRIQGAPLAGGEIAVPASVSSQYISALLMMAPYMEKGLVLRLQGKVVSASYIEMTVSLMRRFGARVERTADAIRVFPGIYTPPVDFRIEADWSAASYFYALCAVADCGRFLLLSGLTADSIQGDARQAELWKRLGVSSSFASGGVLLSRGERCAETLEYDFTAMPDLVQTFVVACCLLGVHFRFSGLDTLTIKETDRLTALVAELARIGFRVEISACRTSLCWEGSTTLPEASPSIRTYGDHRMAMAFAPAVLKIPSLTIRDKEVVSKSFPRFWEEFARFCSCCLS